MAQCHNPFIHFCFSFSSQIVSTTPAFMCRLQHISIKWYWNDEQSWQHTYTHSNADPLQSLGSSLSAEEYLGPNSLLVSQYRPLTSVLLALFDFTEKAIITKSYAQMYITSWNFVGCIYISVPFHSIFWGPVPLPGSMPLHTHTTIRLCSTGPFFIM